ncbi:hypothetical protein [Plasmodium yoelii yoelii]|uniref:Uncharacterized protein n=1 Tax=Plasmodium yoelii yoelii TaxID=73239 RepID=Q7RJ90_PLAYO|nr:hypothetical protein [Plasmodium yoelii yoelii]
MIKYKLTKFRIEQKLKKEIESPKNLYKSKMNWKKALSLAGKNNTFI